MLGFKVDFDKRIFGFDLLRAFAIFCVVHGHGRHLLEGTLVEHFPWINLPHGVDIFFVLSGFLIGYSFINSANKQQTLSFNKALNFWKRSALRILPNYYLILAINYLLVNKGLLNGSTDTFNIFLFISFTQNLFYPFYDFFWESWSLATQEWFYLLFPILLVGLSQLIKIKQLIPILSFTFIIGAIIYRFSISGAEYNSFWWDVYFKKVVLSRIDCIFFGVLTAWLRFYFKSYWQKYALTSFLLGIALFILVSQIERDPNTLYDKVFYLSLSPIYISLCFPLIDQLKDANCLFCKLISYFSILSYAMYLTNLLVIQLLDKHFSNLLINHLSLKYLLYWSITIVLSYLLYILFEKPIASYGNQILHTRKIMYKRIKRGF